MAASFAEKDQAIPQLTLRPCLSAGQFQNKERVECKVRFKIGWDRVVSSSVQLTKLARSFMQGLVANMHMHRSLIFNRERAAQ